MRDPIDKVVMDCTTRTIEVMRQAKEEIVRLRKQVAALETILRQVRNRLAPIYHSVEDEEIAEELARAEYHIDEVLAAIDKERAGKRVER